MASGFTGPTGAVYTIVDNTADYGSVPNNTVESCGGGAGCYAMSVTGARPVAHWDGWFREAITPAALGPSKVGLTLYGP